MTRSTIDLTTPDGACPTSIFRPEGSGPWPAVLFFMDGIGVRPALFTMAERLTRHGYLVALPDLYHRAGPYTPEEMWALLMNPETRQQWRERFHASASNPEYFRVDATAVLDHLAQRADVVQPKVGTTGYCMGGSLSLRAAGIFPERVAAAASFHGGNLAGDAPDSPHLLASRMKARVYVAGAVEDASFPDEMKQRLDDALTAAGVDHVVETYAGARHGWAVSDHPSYDEAAAERHWAALAGLLDRTLKGGAG
jgi:carboxymethylenebutenolidase